MRSRLNKTLIWLCGTGLVFAMCGFWLWPADLPATATTVNAAEPESAWRVPLGPGLLVTDERGSAPAVDADFEQVPAGVVRVDERGHLITDVQLHNAIDSYLLHTDVPSRQIATGKLRAFLKRQLSASPVAEQEAQALVTRYLSYIDEHDAALTRIRFVAASTDSMAEGQRDQYLAWEAQRRNLRLAMLGPAVYKEWYAAEDARCASVLTAMRTQITAPGEVRDDDQAHDTQACVKELGKSFVEVEIEERQWTRDYARYRKALDQLAERDPGRRAVQLNLLRRQIFSTEAERERALSTNLP